MAPEEVRSGRQAGACQRDAQCRAVFMPAKTVCALVKRRYFHLIKKQLAGRFCALYDESKRKPGGFAGRDPAWTPPIGEVRADLPMTRKQFVNGL